MAKNAEHIVYNISAQQKRKKKSIYVMNIYKIISVLQVAKQI